MKTESASMSSPTQALIKRLTDRGLSQLEIERRTKIPQPRLSRWANGEVPDAADDVFKLQALESQLPAGSAR